jgi:hypothetical protein
MRSGSLLTAIPAMDQKGRHFSQIDLAMRALSDADG